ncbi:MAG: hypothetical protein KGL75_03080 [Acidobacteriota bacterium]|nr:hypothetical protein [Acidobacteriota bacterium]
MSKIPRVVIFAILLLGAWAVISPVALSPLKAAPDQGTNLRRLSKPVIASIPEPCDRACLVEVLSSYFRAMSNRCPCGLPLAQDLKYTENGQLVTPGEGIWKTFTGLGTYRIYLADPETGQAGYYGGITEFGRLKGMLALRLKIKDHQIAEVEAIVARQELRPKGGLGENTAGIMTPVLLDEPDPSGFISPDVALLEPLSQSERTPRAGMIEATKKYLQGFERKNASLVPFAAECTIRENGMATTNNPNGPVVDPAHPDFHLSGGSCAEKITQGYFAGIEKPRDAFPLLVDEEQGLVLNLALYDDEGNVKSVSVPGVGAVAVPRNFLRPITFLKPQLFKIESGKIREIDGLAWPVPFGMSSGWQ